MRMAELLNILSIKIIVKKSSNNSYKRHLAIVKIVKSLMFTIKSL